MPNTAQTWQHTSKHTDSIGPVVTLRMTHELRELLDAAARKHRKSVNSYCCDVLFTACAAATADLSDNLEALAESLESCQWEHPLTSAKTCRSAAKLIQGEQP
jgi:uncharacterized protein (DUF1778 family)